MTPSSHQPLPAALDAVPRPVVALGAIVVLAGLDLLGALLARGWAGSSTGTGRTLFFVGGVVTFVVLFCVYAKSLDFADLVPVTFGWIALLQVGLLVIDRIARDRPVSTAQWAAAMVILILEGYLLVSYDGGSSG
jgi:hypothetical protein